MSAWRIFMERANRLPPDEMSVKMTPGSVFFSAY
jgi:hypothetical protein